MASSPSGLDSLQSVRFISAGGKRFALLDADDWEALIEWLETLEDASIAERVYAQLREDGGDRRRAGWQEWQWIEEEVL